MNSQSATAAASVASGAVVLEGRDLCFSYLDSRPVFKDINVMTHKDEMVAIVGPTGTGKSTLLLLLACPIPHIWKGVLERRRSDPTFFENLSCTSR